MIRYGYKNDLSLGRVCLELSLKPFGDKHSIAEYESVARELFGQWKPMLRYADACSVLMWTADGSEILEYTGNMDDSFEWCRFIGIGNWNRQKAPDPADPADRSFHKYPIEYMENPPKMTYGKLRDIIAAIKRVGKEITGLDIEVGETFDPGPEFAYSDFKFNRHREISPGKMSINFEWMHCAAKLHAEARAYAAYPDGIPEGTHIGEFLGRQFMAMKRDVGFDYIWLSNGFGYCFLGWKWAGEVFTGERFAFENAAKIRESIREFWQHFNAEIGDTRVELRGSNFLLGNDIAAHGCPIDEVYSHKNLISPPNSPWAALDSRFGLELAGYLSHIAEIPEMGFPFRYYIHDPWWLNSPWFDRYNRSPHDIYLPLACARLDADCKVTKPFALDFLSADDSLGRTPDRLPNEVIPHILTAYNDYPDTAGLVTWVYPFDEYCRIGLQDGKVERIIMNDWFIESAIDFGFPVSTVISDRNFIASESAKKLDTIFVMPVPEAGTSLEDALFDALDAGARVILYGTLAFASDRLRNHLGITLTDAIDGELTIRTTLPLDTAEINAYPTLLRHESLLSGGGICETADGAEVLAEVTQEDKTRAYAVKRDKLVWIRGSFPHNSGARSNNPPLLDPRTHFVPSMLLRASLNCFGWQMTFRMFDVSQKLPLVLFSKCREALWLNMFTKDTTVKLDMTSPDGAPAPNGMEFIIENSVGSYTTTRWMHTDCRIFIKQKERSVIRCRIDHPNTYLIDECWFIDGLVDAEVTFYPTKGGRILPRTGSGNNNALFLGSNVDYFFDEARGCFVIPSVSGMLHLGWQPAESIGDYKKLDFLRK
ncbi:MAG: hypothetical protein E7632_00950 [Ruminococcaceae bacterium]|nr:hypothetical protein [Oscillospiraceae bacterium]